VALRLQAEGGGGDASVGGVTLCTGAVGAQQCMAAGLASKGPREGCQQTLQRTAHAAACIPVRTCAGGGCWGRKVPGAAAPLAARVGLGAIAAPPLPAPPLPPQLDHCSRGTQQVSPQQPSVRSSDATRSAGGSG
jgi:hypothetical protein